MKNSFSGGDESGVVSILIGLSVLVLSAVALVSFADNGLGSLINSNAHEMRLRNDSLLRAKTKTSLKIEHLERAQKQLGIRHEQQKQLDGLNKKMAEVKGGIALLKDALIAENKMMGFLIESKKQHKIQYREHIRASAAGEQCDEIKTRLGKVYREVRILEVTSRGVRISHVHGAARLGYRDMPEEWRKKFMFTANEMAQAIQAEHKYLSLEKRRLAKKGEQARQSIKSESRLREIASLRKRIASLGVKYSSAQLEARLARSTLSSMRINRYYSNSSYSYKTSRYKSVPGSLETWEGRAVRYERAAAEYAAKLVSLRSQLTSLDPTYAPYSLNVRGY